MNPVSDFKSVRTDPSVQTAAAGDPPIEKYTEDYVASLSPIPLPVVDQLRTLIERERLLGDPRHPRPQVLDALADGLAKLRRVGSDPPSQ